MQQPVPKGTNRVQNFFILGRKCSFRSNCSVTLKAKSEALESQVLTFPSKVQDNQIHKAFHLTMENHVISFENILTIYFQGEPQEADPSSLCNPPNVSNGDEANRAKKLVLFKDNIFNSTEDRGKSDKKNIVKNVVNAYLKYLRGFKEEGRQVDSNLSLLEKMISEKKFNNHLISAIISQEATRIYFKLFLSVEADSWLQHSKIKSKKTYHEALKLYERLCDREEGFHEEGPPSQHPKSYPPAQEKSSSSGQELSFFHELGNNDLEEEILHFK